MFPLDFARPSEFESLLRTGIGFHLRHNAFIVFRMETFQTGCKDNIFGLLDISDWLLATGK